MMRVLLTGSANAQILARQLQYYDVEAYAVGLRELLAAPFLRRFDIIYLVYLSLPLALASSLLSPLKLFGRKFVVHFVGSDAFDYATQTGIKKTLLNSALEHFDEILHVTEEIKSSTGLPGRVIPIPIDTKMFRPKAYEGEKRSVLYYCPHPHKIYREDWIIKYAKLHPEKTITVLGYDHPIDLPNVKIIPNVAYDQMPNIYRSHRSLIRMTTEDGYPKMPYEALLCGLEVFWNERKLTEVPKEMLMENTIPRLIAILESTKVG